MTVKAPPSLFVTDGPELTYTLPLVPRASVTASLVTVWNVLVGGVASLFILRMVVTSGLMAAALGGNPASILLVLFVGWVVCHLLTVVRTILWVAFARRPVLEISAEGLVDRRALRRLVRWDEFEPVVASRRHMPFVSGWPLLASFRLRDPSVRRPSLQSTLESLIFGGRRVVIGPFGFDVPPAALLDLILTMIRNASTAAPSPAASSGAR